MRRPPPCGRQKEAGGEGASESALISERAFTPRDSAKSPASEHRPSGARRYEGWQGTRAAFSGQKPANTRQCALTLLQDEAPPHQPAPVPPSDGLDHFLNQRGPGRALAELSRSVASIAKISVEAIKSLSQNCRCDADYRRSAIHCFVNLLAVVVVTVLMIVDDTLPDSRLAVKRLAVLVVNHLGSPPANL